MRERVGNKISGAEGSTPSLEIRSEGVRGLREGGQGTGVLFSRFFVGLVGHGKKVRGRWHRPVRHVWPRLESGTGQSSTELPFWSKINL